jgi:hypothetical protein
VGNIIYDLNTFPIQYVGIIDQKKHYKYGLVNKACLIFGDHNYGYLHYYAWYQGLYAKVGEYSSHIVENQIRSMRLLKSCRFMENTFLFVIKKNIFKLELSAQDFINKSKEVKINDAS